MAENLKVTHYNNGDEITTNLDADSWINTNEGAYAAYNDDINNAEIYGYLYNGYTFNNGMNICPEGWHIPSKDEFTTLTEFLGGDNEIAGGKMKEIGTEHWLSPNTAATNESGFTAFGGDFRNGNTGNYGNGGLGWMAYFWATNNFPSENTTYRRSLNHWDATITTTNTIKLHGHSIRCLSDDIEGCTDPEACNYDETANVDDGSCLENDCAGTCGGSAVVDACGTCEGSIFDVTLCDCSEGIDMDCTGECGGSAVVDECGVCGGDGSSCEPSICDGLTEVELWGQYYDIGTTTSINLQGQGLTGSIPPEIGCLTNLTYLWLSFNELTGEIPPEIGSLLNLTYLGLSDNQLSGVIPANICDLNLDIIIVMDALGNPLGSFNFIASDNNFCPPYPECVYVGEQDTTNCGNVTLDATLSFGEVDLASQTIEIHLENSAPVSGFQFLLSSDSPVDFVDAYGGSAGENGFTVDIGGNNIVLGFSLSATEIPTGSDVLTIVEYDGYCAEICLSEGVITSGYEDAEFFDVSHGDCISPYLNGDVNMDGVLDVLDIVTIVNIIFETIDPDEYEFCISDYNGDGYINIMDIVQIVNAIFSDDVIIEGCMDDTACNYDESANVDDSSCWYAEENYDCDGNCNVEIDCAGVCGGNNDCIGCNDWYMGNFICDDTEATDKCCMEDDNNNDNRCKINGTGNNCDFSPYCQKEYEMECDLDGEYCDYDGAAVGDPCSASEGSFTEGEGLCILDLSDDVNIPTGYITYYDTGCADGTDSCCTEPECNEPFTLSLEYIDASTLQVNYSSTAVVGGFQFEIVGATTTGGSGGDADANGLSVSGSNSIVIGFSFGGSTIPAGSGILTNLTVTIDPSSENLCLQNLIISDPALNEINSCPEYWQLTCISIP